MIATAIRVKKVVSVPSSIQDLAWKTTALFLITHLALYISTYIVQNVIAAEHHQSIVSVASMIAHWRQFDAIPYTNIALHGYIGLYDAAFFPLYPFLIAITASILGAHHVVIAGLLMSNIGALIGSIGVAAFAYQETHSQRIALWVVLAVLYYPVGFFLAAPYTEGIFLAFAAWSLWAMRGQRWLIAAILIFFASLTRITGIVLMVPLIIEFVRLNYRQGSISWRTIASGSGLLLSAPLGIGLFSFYLGKTLHDPLGFYHAQVFFGHSSLFYPIGLIEGINFYLTRPMFSFTQIRQMVDFLPVMASLAITIWTIRKRPIALSAYTLILFVLSTSGPKIFSPGKAVFVSAGRYTIMAIPVLLVIGEWAEQHPKIAIPAYSASFLIQIVFAVYFLQSGAII